MKTIDLLPLLRGGEDTGVRKNAVERFMASIEGLSRAQARARFREDVGLYRWNRATQAAVLDAMRTQYERGT